MTFKIKICGITRREDIEAAAEAGADYVGVLCEIGYSKRSLAFETVLAITKESSAAVVILIQDMGPEMVERLVETVQPCALQIVGTEPAEYVRALRDRVRCELWKSVHLAANAEERDRTNCPPDLLAAYCDAGANRFVLDATDVSDGMRRFGGTGKTINWDRGAEIVGYSPAPVLLAGGLKPENVYEAATRVKPYGIDLASGVESSYGIKDAARIRSLVSEVRRAEGTAEQAGRGA